MVMGMGMGIYILQEYHLMKTTINCEHVTADSCTETELVVNTVQLGTVYWPPGSLGESVARLELVWQEQIGCVEGLEIESGACERV